MLNDLLKHQLQELGIDESIPPLDTAAWRQFLDKVSAVYDHADDRRLYQSLFDQTNDAVFIIDLTGKYLSVNRKAADMLGYTVPELVRLSSQDVVVPDEFSQVGEILQKLLSGEKVPPYERNFRRKDGTTLAVDINIELVRDVHGNPLYIQSVVRDITERKQAEKKLRESEANLAALLNNSPDAIHALDVDLRFITINPVYKQRFKTIFGVDVEIGKSILDHLPPGMQASAPQLYERVLRGESFSIEQSAEIDGAVEYMDIFFSPMRTPDGEIVGAASFSRNITELKRAADAVRFQATLVDHMHDALIATDNDYRIMVWNRAAERMYGWSAEEVIGKDASEIVVSHLTKDQRQEANRQLFETGYWDGEVMHLHRDGRPINVLSSVSLLRDKSGKPIGMIGIDRDITERQQVQQALRRSEEKLRQLFNATQWQAQELTLLNRVREAVAHEMDLGPLIRTIVEAIADIFGYTYVSLYLLKDDKLLLYHQIGYDQPVPFIPLSKGIIGRTVRVGEPVFVENIAEDPDYLVASGDIASEICVPLFDRDQVAGVFNIESTAEKTLTNDDMRLMIALSEQVSIAVERARLYTSLRESKEQYQMVLDSVREIVFQTDPDGRWLFLNSAWTEITGYKIERSIGQSVLEIIHPADRDFITEKYLQLVSGEITFCRCETRIVTYDGTISWVEIHSRRVSDPGGHLIGMSGTMIDINERKRSEQQAAELLAQSHTVEALRRFLTNVSHDLRTPLSIINTSLYLLRRKFADPQTAVHHLDVLEEQVTHLTRMVEDLVEMSRLEDQIVDFEFISVHLGNLVRDVLVSYETIANNKHLTIQQDCDPDLPSIQADQVWLGRLVRNLVNNAVQYTPDKGTIRLTTSTYDGGVLLAVSDTGVGISPHDVPYIFDRFYRADTARPADKGGAGLGLAIVRKVVDAHSGRVDVESIEGQGSTFRVWLPAKEKA